MVTVGGRLTSTLQGDEEKMERSGQSDMRGMKGCEVLDVPLVSMNSPLPSFPLPSITFQPPTVLLLTPPPPHNKNNKNNNKNSHGKREGEKSLTARMWHVGLP